MSEWKLIETAPKDGTILVFGQPGNVMTGNASVEFNRPAIFTAYWDSIDESFCLSGASWLGHFIEPTHWMPLPDPPK